MLEPEEIAVLQERLRQLLPEQDSGNSTAEASVSKEKAEALEAALNQAFSAYEFLPEFKFLPHAGPHPLNFSEVDQILISYSLPKKNAGTLFITMSKQFVSACLVSALGAESGALAGTNNGRLSPVEVRFACALSRSLLPFIEVITGSGVELECVGATVENSGALTAEELESLEFSMMWLGAKVTLGIALPVRLLEKPNGPMKAQPKHGLAQVMSSVVVKPEIRIRLQDTTLNELVRLKPGDVIAMHSESPDPARVLVKGKEIMSGQIGRLGNYYSIRLNSSSTGLMSIPSSSAVANAYSEAP